MKKVIIFSLMLISALSVDAQRKRTRTATSQGNVVVRFGMGINTHKEDPDLDPVYKTTTVNFTPSVGYMVADNLELGVNFNVANSRGENVFAQSPVISKQNTGGTEVGFGVYVQKYFPLNNWFAFTAAADLGLSTGSYFTDNVLGSVTTPDKTMSGNTSGVGGAVNFGFGFTPYNSFALYTSIAGLGVQTTRKDPDGINDVVNTTDVGFNVHRATSSLTFVWYFGRGLWKK